MLIAGSQRHEMFCHILGTRENLKLEAQEAVVSLEVPCILKTVPKQVALDKIEQP